MSEYNNNSPNYKYYYLPQGIGLGSLRNDQVGTCTICRQNGFEHEPIVFRDGKIVNYYDGTEHEHKEVFDDPRAWAALGWS